jgi:hypothetical protein
MAHSGNSLALRTGDAIVASAVQTSPITKQFLHGNRLSAAGLDALANAGSGLASVPAGYGVISGYAVAAYRGWIGGIVSVDNDHRSRLATPGSAFYYLTTLILQLIPYSLAGGAGVNLGLAAFRAPDRTGYTGARIPFLRVPYAAVQDAWRIYLISLPLFALASVFEFTAAV